MTRSVELRIPFGLGAQLQECVFRRGAHEYVAFGLVSHALVGGRTILLLRELIPLQEPDYIATRAHGAAWRGAAMFPVMVRAVEQNLGIVIFHAHDHVGPAALSGDDIQSAQNLIPMFRRRAPERPHGSIVISRTHAAGLVWLPRARKPMPLEKIRWFGSSIVDFGSRRGEQRTDTVPEFARQALVVGAGGQTKLKAARVTVVGGGGGGSHVTQQLAHLGIGNIAVVDPDVFEDSNRHRLIGGSRRDIGRSKTDILSRMVRKIGLGSRVQAIRAAVPESESIDALKSADIIVGCVDTLYTRSDLQEIASRFHIPYIDIGATIRPIEDAPTGSAPCAVAGHVFTFVPGSFCLWCCGYLSEAKITAEQNGPTRGYFEKNRDEAQVVSLNGLLASQAVTDVLQLLTGFRGCGIADADLKILPRIQEIRRDWRDAARLGRNSAPRLPALQPDSRGGRLCLSAGGIDADCASTREMRFDHTTTVVV
jgi:ThiF family